MKNSYCREKYCSKIFFLKFVSEKVFCQNFFFRKFFSEFFSKFFSEFFFEIFFENFNFFHKIGRVFL